MEIDSEIVAGLCDAAPFNKDLEWSKTLPVGVSKMEHYQGFAEVVEIAKAIVYKATQKFAPNYMVVAANVVPVLTFINGWKAAPMENVAGPYFAGNLNGFKVYVSPMMADGEFFIGVNGADMQTSAAVYAPYMPIVPTQLLQYADGGNSEGFSTMYDFKILAKRPLTFVEDADSDGGHGRQASADRPFSPLLVKGRVIA